MKHKDDDDDDPKVHSTGLVDPRRKPLARRRHALILIGVTVALVSATLLLFYHTHLIIRPNTRLWTRLVDAEDKGPAKGWAIWELLIALVGVPAMVWSMQRRCTRWILWMEYHPRTFGIGLVVVLVFFTTVTRMILQSLSAPCHGWIPSDVGYIWVNTAHNAGHNLRTVCRGKVWEPHVATAVQDYLYGQGRAMDVGAFVGYHALRLAKAAAPHTVYAVEGRARSLGLERNLQRNNARNVQIIPSVIDSHWKLEDTIQKDLLESSIPLCLIKLDCEGCEIHFLKATRDILLKWKPVLIIEIQDDATRQTARLGGQQIIKPEGTRNEVLNLLRDELGYNVSPLLDEDGEETWDYLAIAK